MKKTILIIFLILLTIVTIGLIIFFIFKSRQSEEKVTTNEGFFVNVLSLGDDSSKINNGDAIYILAGDNDILIDAGPTNTSCQFIMKQILDFNASINRTFDNVFEYVIASHMHYDHISGLVGNASNKGILESYKVKTLIDNKNVSSKSMTTKTYQKYAQLINNPNYVEKHLTADHFFSLVNDKLVPNEHNKFSLTKGTTLEILYNSYYFDAASSNENDNSLSVIFKHNNKKYLFTGDLESKGEKELIEYYKDETTLDNVYFFKAGHHGSNTSNTKEFLDLIYPEVIAISCVAGATEYTTALDSIFPTQKTINTFAKHTYNIYVTNEYDKDSNIFKDLNGRITVTNDKVLCSNLDVIFKDSLIFNRVCYVDNSTNLKLVAPDKNKPYYKKDEIPGLVAVPFRKWNL